VNGLAPSAADGTVTGTPTIRELEKLSIKFT